ncbi:hypothetical protein ACFLWY_04795 [Chloroflexota bacterium]
MQRQNAERPELLTAPAGGDRLSVVWERCGTLENPLKERLNSGQCQCLPYPWGKAGPGESLQRHVTGVSSGLA